MAEDHSDDNAGLQLVKTAEDFDDFFRREFPRMVAVAYAVSGSRWAAEELAQEALMRAHRSWRKISEYDKPGAWLRRVTINLANSHVRRRVSEAKALEKLALRGIEPIDLPPDQGVEFWQGVKKLPRRQRETVALHYVDDLNTAEIAEILEISESSVRTHLQRGRENLADQMRGGGES